MRLGLAGLFLGSFVLYAWIGPNQTDTDGWFPLANSFLHGHLWIDGSRPWIERVPDGFVVCTLPDPVNCHYFLPFPPIPAVVLVPVVAVFGQSFADTNGVTALVGAINVLLVLAALGVLGLSWRVRLILTIGFAFASEAFYVAATGGVHLWTETLGMAFVLAALNLGLRGRWPWVAGLLVGLAVGCRPTLLLTAPAFAVLYWRPGGWLASRSSHESSPGESTADQSTPDESPALRPPALRSAVARLNGLLRQPDVIGLALLALGALTIGVWLAWYNLARFGSMTEFGYDLIRGPQGDSVLSEPWYSQGIVSPFYLARGLFTFLLRGWDFSENPPWVIPNWAGCAFYYTTPILIFVARARWRDPLILAGWLGFLLPVGLDLMHGNPGFAQFGYRFLLDGLPFAWLLLGLVVAKRGLTRGMVAAIAIGILVNVYGLACIAAGFVP